MDQHAARHLPHLLERKRQWCVRMKGRNTGQHVVKRHAHGIQIAAMIGDVALGLLWTHV